MVIVGSVDTEPAEDIESSVVEVLVEVIDAEPPSSDAIVVWVSTLESPTVLVAVSPSSLVHAAKVRAVITAAALTVSVRGRAVVQCGQIESELRTKR